MDVCTSVYLSEINISYLNTSIARRLNLVLAHGLSNGMKAVRGLDFSKMTVTNGIGQLYWEYSVNQYCKQLLYFTIQCQWGILLTLPTC